MIYVWYDISNLDYPQNDAPFARNRTYCFHRIDFCGNGERLFDLAKYSVVNLGDVELGSLDQRLLEGLQEELPSGLEVVRHYSRPLFVRVVPDLAVRSP